MKDYSNYKWIKVPKYKMDESKSWEERYKELDQHHIAETSFLIEEVRKLAGQINNLSDKIGEFSDWGWCNCTECRHNSDSHGHDTYTSSLNLEKFVKGFFE